MAETSKAAPAVETTESVVASGSGSQDPPIIATSPTSDTEAAVPHMEVVSTHHRFLKTILHANNNHRVKTTTTTTQLLIPTSRFRYPYLLRCLA